MNDPAQRDYLPSFPYPGIEPYSYSDRKVFFARETEARSLIRLIVIHRGVLLYSDSGAGKSSLINAGLIPLALEEGYHPERIRVQPRRKEEIIIERLSEKVKGEPPFLPSIFASDERQDRVVLSVEKFIETLRQRAEAARPLLIFDQFEEWVTLFEPGSKGQKREEARASQERIGDAIASLIMNAKLPIKILIVLREDYLAKLTPLFKRCPSLPDQYLRLTSLKGEQIYRVIRGPFEEFPERYRPEVSPSLAKEIRTQFESRSEGEDIHLTEVQIVCWSLFDSRGPDLDQIFSDQGGVQGILEGYLERALDSLESNQQEPAVGLLTRMVTSAGTRNVISRDDLLSRVEVEDGIQRELLNKTLDSLEQKTKLVRREARREVYYYEIASEFLVEWIRKKAQERQRLAEQRKLEEAQRAAQEHQHRAEEQAKIARRFRRMTAALVVVFLLAMGAAVFAFLKSQEASNAEQKAVAASQQAKKQAEIAEERRVEAEEAKQKAVAASQQAKKQAEIAEERRVEADEAKQKAVAASQQAKKQAEIAEERRIEADEAKQKAVDAATRARVARERAEKHRKIILARQLAAQSEILRKQHPHLLERSILLAVESLKRMYSPEASQALSNAIALVRHPIASMTHEGGINSISFSPKGKYLAASANEKGGVVLVWDALAGKEIPRIKLEAKIRSIAWGPHGKYLAIAAGPSVEIWESERQERVDGLEHDANVRAVTFSPKGGFVATACADGTAWIWKAANWTKLTKITHNVQNKHRPRIDAIAFSSNEKYLATAGMDGAVRLWDWEAKSDVPIAEFKDHRALKCMTMSPNDRYLATASWGHVMRLWDIAEMREVATMTHDDVIRMIAFSRDGRYLATSSDDQTVRVLDTSTLRQYPPISLEAEVRVLSFSPDGKFIATGSLDLTARLWEVENGREVARMVHGSGVLAVSFSPNGKLLATGSVGHRLNIWDISSKPLGQHQITHRVSVTSLALSPDGRFLVTACKRPKSLERSVDNIVKVWDIAQGRQHARLKHESGVNSIAFNQGENLVATLSSRHTARLWNVQNGTQIKEIKGIEDISPDGRYAIKQESGNSARIIEMSTGREIAKVSLKFSNLIFSSNGEYVVTREADDSILILNTANGSQLAKWSPEGRISKVEAISANATFVAASAEGARGSIVRIWETATKRELTPLSDMKPGSISFSMDEKYFAIVSEGGGVTVWRTIDWQKVGYFAHEAEVLAIAFSPSGRYMATAGSGGGAKVWDLSTGQGVWRKQHGASVNAIAFSHDGSYLATASSDRTAWMGLWRPEDLLEKACSNLNWNLRRDEWREYFGEEPYEKTCPTLSEPSKAKTSISVVGAVYRFIDLLQQYLENETESDLARSMKVLYGEAKKLAEDGDFHRSRAKVTEFIDLALRLEDPKSKYIFDPEVDSEVITISLMLARGRKLAVDGKIPDAIQEYRQFQENNPTLQIPAESWNKLCWEGGLHGFAEQVMDACECGVALAPVDDRPNYRDSRGLARALTGNYQGAVEDFEAYVRWSKKNDMFEKLGYKREAWIAELKAGRNPFNSATLEALKKEGTSE